MDRRSLIAAGLAAGAVGWSNARAQEDIESETLPPPEPITDPDAPPPRAPRAAAAPRSDYAPSERDDSLPEAPARPSVEPAYPAAPAAATYSRNEMVNGVSDFLGVSAESAAAAIEKAFGDNGRPTAYIAGEEGSASFIGGLRYGSGLMYMKGRRPMRVYWRGPSIGFDWGGNASRAFTLCYDLQVPEALFRRFPGVDGSAYLIGGLGVNYQRADGITLAPIRAGVGLRLGANVGYLAYSRRRNYFPF